jgi:hypothetical protein
VLFAGKKMSSARGNLDDVPISGYDRQRLENIAINRKRLESLNLHTSNTTRMTQKEQGLVRLIFIL